MSEQGFKIQILNFLLWPHNVLTEALVILFREEEMVCFKIKGQLNLILLFSNFEKKNKFSLKSVSPILLSCCCLIL